MSQQIELSVGGMTCASCQRRVEKALTKIEGVSATVNYATGMAVVESDRPVDSAQLIQAIENVGYSASLTEKAVEKIIKINIGIYQKPISKFPTNGICITSQSNLK